MPTIKISENVAKITTPGFKSLYRIYDKSTMKAEADVVCLNSEKLDELDDEIFHPIYTWKRKKFTNFVAKNLMVKVFEKGKLVYDMPTLEEIKGYAQKELASLWDEVKRLENPHEYIVDLSRSMGYQGQTFEGA